MNQVQSSSVSTGFRCFRVSLQMHDKRLATFAYFGVFALILYLEKSVAVAQAATQRMFITCRGTNWRKRGANA